MQGRSVIRAIMRVGGLLGAVLTIGRGLLNWYGELDTARSAFESRGPILDMIGVAVGSSWFGPLVAGLCLSAFVTLDHRLAIARSTQMQVAYVTDDAFLNRRHRQRLAAGTYHVRAVLTIGDVAHHVEHYTQWRAVVVG